MKNKTKTKKSFYFNELDRDIMNTERITVVLTNKKTNAYIGMYYLHPSDYNDKLRKLYNVYRIYPDTIKIEYSDTFKLVEFNS